MSINDGLSEIISNSSEEDGSPWKAKGRNNENEVASSSDSTPISSSPKDKKRLHQRYSHASIKGEYTPEYKPSKPPRECPRHSPKSNTRRQLFRKKSRHSNLLILAIMLASVWVCACALFLMGNLGPPIDKREEVLKASPSIHPQNSVLRSGQLPRVIFYEGQPSEARYQALKDDPTLHAPPGEEAPPQDGYYSHLKDRRDASNCVPMHKWQTLSYPNCNDIHELDLRSAGRHVGMKQNTTEQEEQNDVSFEDSLKILGQGWFRAAWKVTREAMNESVVLKTLRIERPFFGEFFDLHRRDAVAMERLTHSNFVMDIYGYCGQSAINELADFSIGEGNAIGSLQKFDRHMRGKHKVAAVDKLKLQIGASLAVGVAHVHEIEGRDNPASMVHYDLNAQNIAMTKGGRPKLNDFNTAEFLMWNPKTNKTCGFPSRLHEPWHRAPEEVFLPKNKTDVRYVNEKVDVFSLGNLLYHVLTTHNARGKVVETRMEMIREEVMQGKVPAMDEFFIKSKKPIHVAFKSAMRRCFELDPEKRGTAREVADILLQTLEDVRQADKAKKEKEQL